MTDTDTPSPLPPGFSLEPVRFSHEPDCVRLLHATLGGSEQLWRERFDHWNRNPAHRASIARGWVVTAADGSIAGFLANATFRYADDDGSQLACVAAHTLAVRPDMRGRGLARSLINAGVREPCDFSIGVQTNPGGWASTLAGGAQSMDQEWTRKPRLIVVDAGALLRTIVRRAAGRTIAPTPGSLDEAGSALTSDSGTQIDVVVGFDPGDDPTLAEMVARPARIRPWRDAATLNWLYGGTRQLRATRLVLTARRAGRLVGYAGFRVLPRSLVLLECRTLPEAGDATRELLGAARQWGRQRRLSHLLVYVYSSAIRDALPRWASWPGLGLSRFPYAIAIKKPGLVLADLELGPWDGDAIIADDSRA